MKLTAVILITFLALVGNASLSEKYSQFKAYGLEYGKKYETRAVEFYRFGIYLKNLLVIEALNLNPDDSALYG
jgi:cathepsin F